MYGRILQNVTPPQAYSSPAMAHQAQQFMAATSTVNASSHLESTLRVIWSLRFDIRTTTRVHGRMGDFYKEQDSVS